MESVGERFIDKDVFFCTLGTNQTTAGSNVSLNFVCLGKIAIQIERCAD